MNHSASPEVASEAKASAMQKVWTRGTLTYTAAGLAVLFCWLLWADFAWQMKERAIGSVVTLLFSQHRASDFLTGLLIGSLPQAIGLIFGPIIAYQSDHYRSRWGRRIPFLAFSTPFVVLSMVGLAFSPALGGWIDRLLGPYSPGANGVVLICLGLFWTLFEFATIVANSMFGALVNDVVPVEVTGRFFGLFRMLSLLAGIGFNYWLLKEAEQHYFWILIALAALYGIGLGSVSFFVKEGEYPPPPAARPNRGVRAFVEAARDYFKECFGIPYYWWYYAYIPISWMAFLPINLFSLYFAKDLQMDLAMYGKCLSVTFACSLIMAYPLGALADRLHPLRLGLVIQGFYAVTAFLGGLYAVNSNSFAVALVAHGVISGAWMTATASIAQRLLPKEQFAQFGSAVGTIGAFTSMITAPLVGMILDWTHHVYRYTYFISSGLTVLALLCGVVLYAKFRACGGPDRYIAPV